MPDRLTLSYIATVPISLAFFRGQAAYMRAQGLDIHAISSPGKSLASFAEREQAAVHAVPMTRRITPVRDFVALLRLYLRLRSIRPTIVHAFTPKAGLLGVLSAWLARVPVRIYHIQGLPLMRS